MRRSLAGSAVWVLATLVAAWGCTGAPVPDDEPLATPGPALQREGCERPDAVALHAPAALAAACEACADLGPEDVQLVGSVSPGAAEQWRCLHVTGAAMLHVEVESTPDSGTPWLDLTLFARPSPQRDAARDDCTRSPGEEQPMVRFQPVFRTATTDQPVEAGIVLVRVLSCSTQRHARYVLRARIESPGGSAAPASGLEDRTAVP